MAGRVVACVVVALALGACRGTPSGAATPAGAGGRVGQELPDVKIVALDGTEHTTASLRGKVVIVDFWDTWCGPCLRALPHLKELSRTHQDQVVVIAVALGQEGEGKVRQVVAKQELPFAVALLDAQGDLAPAFGSIDQLPTTFVVGPDGVIRQRFIGAQSLPTYEKAVKALLPGQGG